MVETPPITVAPVIQPTERLPKVAAAISKISADAAPVPGEAVNPIKLEHGTDAATTDASRIADEHTAELKQREAAQNGEGKNVYERILERTRENALFRAADNHLNSEREAAEKLNITDYNLRGIKRRLAASAKFIDKTQEVLKAQEQLAYIHIHEPHRTAEYEDRVAQLKSEVEMLQASSETTPIVPSDAVAISNKIREEMRNTHEQMIAERGEKHDISLQREQLDIEAIITNEMSLEISHTRLAARLKEAFDAGNINADTLYNISQELHLAQIPELKENIRSHMTSLSQKMAERFPENAEDYSGAVEDYLRTKAVETLQFPPVEADTIRQRVQQITQQASLTIANDFAQSKLMQLPHADLVARRVSEKLLKEKDFNGLKSSVIAEFLKAEGADNLVRQKFAETLEAGADKAEEALSLAHISIVTAKELELVGYQLKQAVYEAIMDACTEIAVEGSDVHPVQIINETKRNVQLAMADAKQRAERFTRAGITLSHNTIAQIDNNVFRGQGANLVTNARAGIDRIRGRFSGRNQPPATQ